MQITKLSIVLFSMLLPQIGFTQNLSSKQSPENANNSGSVVEHCSENTGIDSSQVRVGNLPEQRDRCLLKSGDKVIFYGDSITFHGAKPDGYISLVSEKLKQTNPELKIELIGAGVRGNKVPDLQTRLKRDVLKKKPDLVVIYIGINDAWHWTKPHPRTGAKRNGTTAEEYEAGLREIIRRIQAQNTKVLLCTPSVIGEDLDLADPNNQRLDAFADICRKVASETGSSLIDLRTAFIAYLKENNPRHATKGILTEDTVHLNSQGNQLVALQILKALMGTDTKSAQQNLHIYLLIGQSNMAGRAPFTEEEAAPIDRCYLLNDKDKWEPATNPLNRYSTIRLGLERQKMSPGYSFSKAILEENEDISIGLVVNAQGGTGIEEWAKGTLFYEEAIRRAREAQKSGTLKGILWHQGESNRKNPAGYLDKLSALILNLRSDLDSPNLPFVAGQVNDLKEINDQIAHLPEKVPFTGFTSSNGLTAMDRWHFDTPSMKLLGIRYAKEILNIQAE